VAGFPTAFTLGPLHFYTYGLGLAIAGLVAYRALQRRFTKGQLATDHLSAFALWIVVTGMVGARLASIATNWHLYSHSIGSWFALWHGGLASFGAIVAAVPVALVLRRKWWPDTSLVRFLDVTLPALLLGWAVGRFLGPQFMYQGGGHLTHQWFGLRYAGQVGKRVPVPIIQGLEDSALLGVALLVERRHPRPGVVAGIIMLVWGFVRALDERLLLGQHSHSGSLGVQIAGLALSLTGAALLVRVAKTRTA
jgi:phosphatidylglycerol:prolipoprotein diacylglycerol transferase